MSDEVKRPKVNDKGQRELDKAEKQLEQFNDQVNELTDRTKMAAAEETEPQTKLSVREQQKQDGVYLKPHRSISSQEKFNEKFRAALDFDKQYVKFIAEHNEIIGETIEIWTKPYPGMPAEEWKVPTNKVVQGPRYLAERIKSANYNRLVMDESPVEQSGIGTIYGRLVASKTIQRLDARPVVENKSIFMGARNF